nr:PREDICTED: protein LMBR1L [Latimeria chalumnae]|eukprot:XP_014348576.1 PREDICTED: protein LMBR1L [Latimeria chalumnae]
METDDVSVREQLFHHRVRECLICSLLFASLYIMSYVVIARFKRNTDFATIDNEDATVNKIALWMCTFTLAVSVGAVLLLPFSIVSNEILLSFPQNYYIEWLNGSLIHGLWNLVFLFSNLSLVFLMPFAYFFTESEGFAGSRKLTSSQKLTFCSFFLVVCTPFGLSRMFTVTGKLLVKPMLLENLDEQLNCVHFEEATVSRKLENGKASCWLYFNVETLNKQVLAIQARRIALDLIIGNCVSLVVLSSAIPVFSRTLGITNFDLLGDFGRFNWLGNFYIVFLYNMLFAGLTTMCLVKKFTWAVQAELIRAFGLDKFPLSVSRSGSPNKVSTA